LVVSSFRTLCTDDLNKHFDSTQHVFVVRMCNVISKLNSLILNGLNISHYQPILVTEDDPDIIKKCLKTVLVSKIVMKLRTKSIKTPLFSTDFMLDGCLCLSCAKCGLMVGLPGFTSCGKRSPSRSWLPMVEAP